MYFYYFVITSLRRLHNPSTRLLVDAERNFIISLLALTCSKYRSVIVTKRILEIVYKIVNNYKRVLSSLWTMVSTHFALHSDANTLHR